MTTFAFKLHGDLIEVNWLRSTDCWTLHPDFKEWCEDNFQGAHEFVFIGDPEEKIEYVIPSRYWLLLDNMQDAILLRLLHSDCAVQIDLGANQ